MCVCVCVFMCVYIYIYEIENVNTVITHKQVSLFHFSFVMLYSNLFGFLKSVQKALRLKLYLPRPK